MTDTPAAKKFVAVAQTAGLTGPLLVVATSDIVGRFAPTWAAALLEQGLCHRVLVVDPRCPLAAEDIKSEASSLAAKGLLAVGNTDVIRTASVAAQQSNLPIATLPES